MLLQVMKSMARTLPGRLNIIKQDIGEENWVIATYLPLQFNLGDLGPALELDDTLDKVISPLDCLVGGSLSGRTNLSHLNPIHPCPAVSDPVGHMSISRMGFGEDKRVSVVYSPGNVMGDRDFSCLGSQHEDCSEYDF